MNLVDTHAHLEEIAGLDKVLGEAQAAGVSAVVAVGSDAASNQKALEIARSHPGLVYPALGLHPWNLREATLEKDLESIAVNLPKAVAVGEVGLDYHKKVKALADKELQHTALRRIMEIARTQGKPVIIHSRYAWRDAFDLVVAGQPVAAVFHWYTGTTSVLRDIIDAGYYLSANPAVEYHEEHRRAVKEAPLNRLLLETDSPVFYGRDAAGYESRPADTLRVARAVAELKHVDIEELASITTANARRFFKTFG